MVSSESPVSARKEHFPLEALYLPSITHCWIYLNKYINRSCGIWDILLMKKLYERNTVILLLIAYVEKKQNSAMSRYKTLLYVGHVLVL